MTFEIDEAYLVQTRRHLHMHPELSLKEYETAAFIEEQLNAFGIKHRRVGSTGVLGTIFGRCGTGKTVLLRADIDALPVTEESGVPYSSQNPGVMHACGHDAHTAALLGAAKALQAIREEFRGLVLLVFQPAEEFGHGSRFFQGLDECADRAFAVHVSPDLPVHHIGLVKGAAAAACDFFRITIHGKGAHITRPHQGVDALYIASLLATELKSLTTRLLDPFETALIGVGKLAAGTAYNVIAGEAVLEGSVRSFSNDTQALLKTEIAAAAEHLAATHGGRADIEFETFAPALINDDDTFDEVLSIASDIVGPERVIVGEEAGMGLGADDFAVFLQDAKGAYARIGTANEDDSNTKQELHNGRFDIDERALPVAARLYTDYTLSILQEVFP